jgi:hypothetical protein
MLVLSRPPIAYSIIQSLDELDELPEKIGLASQEVDYAQGIMEIQTRTSS